MNQKSRLFEIKRLKGLSALVTGASSGIGKAIAVAMGREGANVAVNYRSSKDKANEVVEEIKRHGVNALAVKADVSSPEQVQAMFDKVLDEFGTLDVLVGNSGIQKDGPFLEMSTKDWQIVLDVNLTGNFLCAQHAAREFKRRGVIPERSPSAGKIIFISSVHELIPWTDHCNYTASKGGLMMFMKSIAQELAHLKIRVNSIAPGAVKTSINEQVWSDPGKRKELLNLIPADRLGDPQDIATVAVWLASDESDYVHGTTIFADGGMTLYPGFAGG